MISLVSDIPKITLPLAEVVKINCTYNSYKDIAMFWVQNQNNAIISMLDGNMTVYNNGADIEELRQFINVILPLSVFSDADTLTALFINDFHRVYVMKSEHRFECDLQSHNLNSSEIYKLLDVDGLELPPYEHFAVDFCYRLNHGQLKYFALRTKCAAVAISDGQAALLNGIASHQKGMGRVALCGILSQYDTPYLAVCEEKVIPFYLKNNFSRYYDAGYWRKNP
ncbi:MAG: hypothetical protein IJY79_00145 [Clostridia bacterium]|nr:hypothetical protein [Clostridia bacterium]